jgi:CO/xanthine dehydrogenase Mo-binding subunit
MRAPGEPQAFFAAESHIDCIARRLGIEPVEFRLKNLIDEGDQTLTGQHYKELRARATLNAAIRSAGYSGPKRKGVGRGVAMGYRAPGGGATSVAVEMAADGSVIIHTSYYEQGTGTYTTLRQIVAEELSLNPEQIRIKILDTDLGVPFDSGIGGSRGTRVATGAAFEAARKAKAEILETAEKLLGWPRSEITLKEREIVRKKTGQRRRWDKLLQEIGRSIFHQAVNRDDERSPVTAFAAQIAEVAVDMETGKVNLLRLTTAHDTGIIVNPVGHQGQVEGGVIQGVGYGLIEEVSVDQGRVTTVNFGDYKLPNVKDIPKLKTVIVKSDNGVGPYKTKGIGENPISPVAPAIANAIEDAVGVRIHDLPITSEKVYQALQEKRANATARNPSASRRPSRSLS